MLTRRRGTQTVLIDSEHLVGQALTGFDTRLSRDDLGGQEAYRVRHPAHQPV